MWYLPHFAVVKRDSSTTIVRILFDAATRYHGVSLNDAVFQGPKLRHLFDVLLRFRRYLVAVMCDILEMYLRIELIAEDRPYHRFLWRDMKVDQKPSVYEFNRLIFGVNSLRFLAQLVSQYHARLHEKSYPRAAETILKSTYNDDDSMDSVMSDDDGIELYEQLSESWEKADMFTHKWLSNSTAVLNKIPVKDGIQEVDLDKGVLRSVKTLGVVWIAGEDDFMFKTSFLEQKDKFTKQEFLKRIATIFDPLGFVSPFTIRQKVLIQEMWVSGLDWDDEVPKELSIKIALYLSELSSLSQIKVQSSGVTFADAWAKPGQATSPVCSIHTHVHLHMDINILLKICCTSYSVCNVSILAIAMITLQVYEQYRLIQALLVP